MGFEQSARDAGVNIDMQTIRAGNFDLVVVVNDIAYVSGSIALKDGGIAYPGRLGENMDIETGQASARGAAEAILAALHQHLGSLDSVVRVVRLTGYVSSAPGFGDQPKVINGASDLHDRGVRRRRPPRPFGHRCRRAAPRSVGRGRRHLPDRALTPAPTPRGATHG